MSGFKKFFIIMTAVLAVSISILIAVLFSYKDRRIDTVMINDLTQTVRENWNDLDELDSKDIKTSVIILDSNNRNLYTNMKDGASSIKAPLDAMQQDMICITINEGDTFLGTLIIPDPANEEYSDLLIRVAVVTALIVLIMLAAFASFIIYINRNIVKPFNRMRKFASTIAMGNLDEPLMMEKNNMFGIFTESFDVMREELKASRQREIALKMKEKELVASLSHDLKTPVTGIRVICELLAVKVQDEYVRSKISNIEHKTEEIDILISDLLSSALDDMGEMNVNCTSVTSDVLTKLVEEHDPRKKAVPSEVPDCILNIDVNRMSQVIGNIITNSYKYADTPIDVSYKFDGRFLKMDIRDHGEGVNKEEIDLLTNKFYRSKENTDGKDGSGLGLYISRELMNKMGGQLICSSDEDGFEVSLMIPLA